MTPASTKPTSHRGLVWLSIVCFMVAAAIVDRPAAGDIVAAEAGTNTLAQWRLSYGDPTSPIGETSPSDASEPLLVYWLQALAAPLGVGPKVPGTLVATFAPAQSVEESELVGYTFLAVAAPADVAKIVADVTSHGWVAGREVVQRKGGAFEEFRLVIPDGGEATLAVRQDKPTGAMADGRPSPSFWLHFRSGQSDSAAE